jgi:hypothetical protein
MVAVEALEISVAVHLGFAHANKALRIPVTLANKDRQARRLAEDYVQNRLMEKNRSGVAA